ncbi:TPA: hypothetical protein N0F65_000376 [Lagenidium giganteum]|uniref:Flavodoxin-like domain-containing protein n=1 Tax=Lagenidium giganteum TaxID=4803 RepID=A0AAV2Z383_9STRA|nr:TPA: hypothetical protein N0F65_000376 [Lagenidium giganteum]
MTTRIAIIYYSTYGRVAKMAEAVREGAARVPGVRAEIFQLLKDVDGVLLGIPTRFGSMPAQMKAFMDQCGGLWKAGALTGKPAGMFVSTGGLGSGQETTQLTATTFLAHMGMTFVPLGYRTPLLGSTDEVHGGGPWGAGTIAIAGTDGPTQLELDIARVQGESFAEIAKKLAA